MRSTKVIRGMVLVASVAMVLVMAAQPVLAVGPKGNLTGVWKDQFGNKLLITQHADTRKVTVKYSANAGNLIWKSAAGQVRKQGNQWILETTLRLKSGGTKQRNGRVIVGRGVIVWPAGNRWTLIENQATKLLNLEQNLAEAERRSAVLVQELRKANQKSQQERDLMAKEHVDLQALTAVLLQHALTEDQRHRCGTCVEDANSAAENAGVANDAPVALFPEQYTVPLTISPNGR